MKTLIITGAGPNSMRAAPLIRVMARRQQGRPSSPRDSGPPRPAEPDTIMWKVACVPHESYGMDDASFDGLEIPQPDYLLGVGLANGVDRPASVMEQFGRLCKREQPDAALVVGDVNPALTAAVMARKRGVPVACVDAGLRNQHMTAQQKIDRIVMDSIADYLFVSDRTSFHNLIKEGKSPESVFPVGHLIVDELVHALDEMAAGVPGSARFGVLKERLGQYIFVTLRKPSIIVDTRTLRGIVSALNQIAQVVPILFPLHPETGKMFEASGITLSGRIHILPTLSFMESLFLWKDAVAVMTDNATLQEGTTALGVPCFTIGHHIERPITMEEGTNILAGTSTEGILSTFDAFRRGERKAAMVPELWDGHAAERIVDVLVRKCGQRKEGCRGVRDSRESL